MFAPVGSDDSGGSGSVHGAAGSDHRRDRQHGEGLPRPHDRTARPMIKPAAVGSALCTSAPSLVGASPMRARGADRSPRPTNSLPGETMTAHRDRPMQAGVLRHYLLTRLDQNGDLPPAAGPLHAYDGDGGYLGCFHSPF